MIRAAVLGDRGDRAALIAVMMAKADAVRTAEFVTDEAVKLAGGEAFREDGRLLQLLRDAGAAAILSPATDILKTWIGRLQLGLPML